MILPYYNILTVLNFYWDALHSGSNELRQSNKEIGNELISI